METDIGSAGFGGAACWDVEGVMRSRATYYSSNDPTNPTIYSTRDHNDNGHGDLGRGNDYGKDNEGNDVHDENDHNLRARVDEMPVKRKQRGGVGAGRGRGKRRKVSRKEVVGGEGSPNEMEEQQIEQEKQGKEEELKELKLVPGFDTSDDDDSDDDDEEDINWETITLSAPSPTAPPPPRSGPSLANSLNHSSSSSSSSPSSSPSSQPLELTLHPIPTTTLTSHTKKKGASTQDRRLRLLTHCLHVQMLVYSGWVRNRWVSDEEVGARVLSHVPAGLMREVERVRYCVDTLVPDEASELAGEEEKRRRGKKGKGKQKEKQKETEKEKDKEKSAASNEQHLIRVCGSLMHWWKHRFHTTLPGLRKHGYRSGARYIAESRYAEETGRGVQGITEDGRPGRWYYDYGETVRGVQGMRESAERCEGSRDMGAMLFTALLRALGWRARLVFALRPIGFGVGAKEEAGEFVVPREEGKGGEGKVEEEGEEEEEESESSLTELSSEEDSDTPIRAMKAKGKAKSKSKPTSTIDRDLPYPNFWTELLLPHSHTYLTIDPHVLTLLGNTPSLYTKFEPRGAAATATKQVSSYTLAYSPDHTIKDVTTRYLSSGSLPGKTKGFRLPPRDIPIYNLSNELVSYRHVDWFSRVLRPYLKPHSWRTAIDDKEDTDLLALETAAKRAADEKKELMKARPRAETVAGYKNHPELVLERHLKREEALRPGAEVVKFVTLGKGEKKTTERVYWRKDVRACKAVENWTKEGRRIKVGEQPLKEVKRRAVTLRRKREVEEKAREGETVVQGLYSFEQTELNIPPPITNGIIPKNAFNNIDAYVPSLIPQGAVHIRLPRLAPLARKLGIDYADAVIGFEFKQQRAVPCIDGIVVAEEFEDVLREAWTEAEEVRRRKEEGKRREEAVRRWGRFVRGLRVLRRVRGMEMWGGGGGGEREGANPFAGKETMLLAGGLPKNAEDLEREGDEDGGVRLEGGFLRSDGNNNNNNNNSYDPDSAGGFILDDPAPQPSHSEPPPPHSVSTNPPISLQSLLASHQSKPSPSSSLSSPPPLSSPERELSECLDSADATSEYFSPHFSPQKKRKRGVGVGGRTGTPVVVVPRKRRKQQNQNQNRSRIEMREAENTVENAEHEADHGEEVKGEMEVKGTRRRSGRIAAAAALESTRLAGKGYAEEDGDEEENEDEEDEEGWD
ncbi:Rad4-domain-containing protein [Ascodesmis nigricans]|uniref:Rad4-domain-containing protein n=1 Tax=Ascodesmis nigricans TaxID=341454 RepID=A0A4S2N0P4_9PEZI|nr:Rad4-domain-containing protein [Ascodesmis nigricans]